MRRLGLLLLAVPFSTVAHAQYPFAAGNFNSAAMEGAAKVIGCSTLTNNALNPMGGYFAGGNIPFSLVDGKVNVLDQERFISKTTNGDTETVEYKANQVVGFKDGKAITEVVRQTVLIKRKNGKIVSISHPQDLKKSAVQREEFKKTLGKNFKNYDLLKSTETTFNETDDGRCETNQKEYVLAKDEKGKVSDTIVTYDAELCKKLQPAISKIGKNNAQECGPLLATAERLIGERAQAMKAGGKTLAASFGTQDASMSTFSVSSAITNCIQEEQAGSGYQSLGYGMGMGGVFAGGAVNMGMGTPTDSSSYKKSNSKQQTESNPGNR